MGILNRVIVTPAVYPRFDFLDVDLQRTGHTLSRPWLGQLNDVMSEIECAQVHNELLGRRHSTMQSHRLVALAKHLLLLPHMTTGMLGYIGYCFSVCRQDIQ